MSPERYNDLLIGLQQLGIGISMNLSGYDSEFLELFAHKEALTASEITRLIKSTELEMAPKNVNRKVHKLK